MTVAVSLTVPMAFHEKTSGRALMEYSKKEKYFSHPEN